MSRSWVRRVLSSVVAAVAAGSLVAVDATAVDAAALAPRAAVPVAVKPKPKVTQAADLVSARVAARSQGVRVEALSERTEVHTTWVNPDGTLTTDVSSAPVRFKDRAGAWRPVDLNLVRAAGDVVPGGMALGVRLSGGGAAGSEFASVDHGGGRSVAWTLGGALKGAKLPAPVLKERVATYPDVSPGVDVRVAVRPRGFEHDFLVKDRAAADAVAAAGGSWQIPLKTKGLTAKATAEGGVEFVDVKGKRVSFIPAAQAWDAKLDPRSGDPASPSKVKLSVVQSNPGLATLTVTPDAAWLADPARVFPVTVDPTYATLSVYASFDTWVATNYTTDQSTSTELKAGTYDGGTTKARSFLTFPINFHGYDVTSASLSLYETHSYSCTAKPLYVHSANGASTSTRWTSQPWINSTSAGSATVAKGYSSSCPDGRISIPITALIQSWENSTSGAGGIALKASETDSYGWKRFYSSNGTYVPVLSVSYNRKPNAATTPTMGGAADGANSFTTPSTGSVLQFTKDSTPKFYSNATDPDGSKVAVTFEVHTTTSSPSSSTLAASCATALGNSGASVSCSPTTALAENKTYYVRAAVKDERGLWNGTWSGWKTFYTSWSPPPAPKVACDRGYGNGTWTDADPAGTVTCSITAAGVSGTYQAPGYLDMTVDGVAQSRLTITPTNDWAVVHKTFTFAATARGYHEIKVTGISRSLVSSAQTVFGFGWGAASMTSPTTATASSGRVKATAGGPPKGSATAVTAKVQWRVAGSGNETTGWTDSASGPVTVTPSGTAAASYSGVFDLTSAVREAGASVDVPKRTPVRLDLQVCFTYTGSSTTVQCTWSQSAVTVTRLPHAFGGGYPTTDAGVGQVALYTGELAADATDVSVPGYSGAITVSRSHTSFAGDQSVDGWPSDPVTGVFGPGWTANLEGGAAGLAGLQVVDQTGIDGSIAFVDGEGEPLVYANPDGTRTYPASGTVTYEPATQDTFDAGMKLTVAGTGTAMRLTLTEDDGTKTTWAPLATPSTTGTTWRPDTISEPGQTGKTTYGSDPSGRVTRIVAPVPDGMTGTSCPTSGTLARGCRAIEFSYATTTTATSTTPGDMTGQAKAVSAWLWNPATSSMTQTTVATYAYDASGRLVQVRDPRTGLGTDYTWDGTSTRIASIRQNTLAATKLAYSSGKLTQVSREAPVTGQADVITARYLYGIPTSGTGLPDLTGTGVWFQAKAPVTGYAVFGQDYTGPVSGTGVDWTYADLTYVDDLGYSVNTAAYGAGAWQVTSTDYDTTTSNVVRQLDASATAAAAKATTALTPAQVDALSTQTIYNTEVKDAAGAVVLPAGSRVTDTYGPAREVVLTDGSVVLARPRTHTEYDQGAPNGGINPATGQRYSLPTTVTDSAATGIGADAETVSVTTTGYAKINAADATEGDGWALGAATTTSTWTNTTSASGAITSTTRYDTLGRTTETRQPKSDGTDAGTTRTAYYTVAAQDAPNASCGGHPEWAGLTCRTYPAAAPDQGPTMPDTATTAYTMWLKPATVLETSGAASRTTTTTYDPAERPVSSKTTTSGLAGSTARPGSYTKYRTDTGLPDYTGPLNTAGTDADTTGRTSYSYDRWGRAATLTGDAGQVTTAYDTAGRVESVTDAKGTRTYGYDGTSERRGLLTSLTVSRPGTGGTLTYTASYDADGQLTRQDMPGGLTQVTEYDEGGEPIALTYLGQVTPVTASTDPETGETTYTPSTPKQDQPWMSWSTVNDITGRARLQETGTGAAFDDGTGVASVKDIDDVEPWTADAVGQASSYAREYRYDPAGRLTYARSADASPDPATGSLASTCTERSYSFDTNGRRTNLATTSHPDGDCDTAGTTSSVATAGWDSADRPTTARGGTGSYSSDLFGRQTTLPAADAPDPSKGDITLGYYDDDLPRTITQGDTSSTFTLDAAGRRATQTTTTPAGTTSTVRRYTDDGDNPAWIETTAPGANTATVTRFAASVGGNLSATIDQDGSTSLSLADPHGDIVTTVPIDAAQASTTPAVTITGWTSYDEYGNPASSNATDQVDGPLGYGWLGAKQRSTTTGTAGLTLMGVRLYNPTRGLFTNIDPVPGGNSTAYTYPQDPINMFDLDGRWGWFKKAVSWAWKNRATIAAVSTFFCTICATAMAIYAGYKAIQAARRGDWGGAAWSAAGAFGGGRALRGLTAAGARGAKFSGKVYRNRAAAERAAHRYANKRPHTRQYRGTHGRNPDHVHVDTHYGGRVVHTRHYYW